jgi:serine/threonine protein kinase
MSLEGLDFMNCCLQHNPKERLSWEQLLKHQYLNYDWRKFVNEDQQPKEEDPNDLLLSFNEKSGIYSVPNAPH